MAAKKSKTIANLLRPEDDFRVRVRTFNEEVQAVQIAWENAVADAWRITNDAQAMPGPVTVQTYRQRMRELSILSRELRQEKERHGYTSNVSDAITYEAKTVWGQLYGRGIINPLRPGVVNARPDATAIAQHSHDKTIGIAERT